MRLLVLFISCLLIPLLSSAAAASAASDRPNIVLMLSDNLGFGEIGVVDEVELVLDASDEVDIVCRVGHGGDPGVVVDTDSGVVVACGEGALRLRRVQRPGRNAVTAEEWCRAENVSPGDRLGGPAS